MEKYWSWTGNGHGSFLSLDTQSDKIKIFTGSNLIEFRVLVQREQDAVANRDVVLRSFSTTGTNYYV